MKKNMKVGIAIVSVLVFGGTGVGLYVSNMNKEVANPVPVVEEKGVINTVENEKVDTVVNTETGLTDNDTVETEDSAFVINTEIDKVIESDEETGSETIVNTDGDVVVINDEALLIAESNSGAEDILASIMSDYVIEDNTTVEKTDKAEIKVDKPEVKKSDEELKKVYSSETTSTKKNDDVEIDQATKDLFAEMGWRGDASKDIGVDTSEGRVVPYEGKGNPFRTP